MSSNLLSSKETEGLEGRTPPCEPPVAASKATRAAASVAAGSSDTNSSLSRKQRESRASASVGACSAVGGDDVILSRSKTNAG